MMMEGYSIQHWISVCHKTETRFYDDLLEEGFFIDYSICFHISVKIAIPERFILM